MSIVDSGVSFAQRCLNRSRRILNRNSAENRRLSIQRYEQFTGKTPDLQNPKGFLEKLLWLNLYYRNKRIPPLVDKYLARDQVKQILGPEVLNQLYGVWNRPEEIPFDKLPDQFVLKATAGSGWNILCRNKAKLGIVETIANLRNWQSQNYYYRYREWQYKSLRSRIIAERLLVDPNHPQRSAPDFKLFCFNGTPRVLGVNSDRWGDARHDFFDCQWNPVDYGLSEKMRSEPPLPRPKNLERLLAAAEKLARGFPFVRVDLYQPEDRIVFGEMTFSPCAGNMTIQQPEADLLWGSWLTLPV
jgi:hypothetical protein